MSLIRNDLYDLIGFIEFFTSYKYCNKVAGVVLLNYARLELGGISQ